jgi:hypothetical protein
MQTPVGAQTWLAQSAPVAHALPEAHGGQPPPQSTSVSAPFFTWSVHEGGAHAFAHTRDAQSFATRHSSFAGHATHEPPQSTSDSEPFWTWSLHEGEVHDAHVPESQRHGAQEAQGPPQSTPDSPPFWMPSVHVAATQWFATQCSEAQSLP